MIEKISPEITATVLSMIIATLRIIYDDRETTLVRIALESLLCGFLTLAVFHAILAIGLDVNWSVCAGGIIGFFGTDLVRKLAVKYINNKIK